jgi:hypothetical protein
VRGLAIINDADKETNDEYLEALASKGAGHILWSERQTAESRRKLKAA